MPSGPSSDGAEEQSCSQQDRAQASARLKSQSLFFAFKISQRNTQRQDQQNMSVRIAAQSKFQVGDDWAPPDNQRPGDKGRQLDISRSVRQWICQHKIGAAPTMCSTRFFRRNLPRVGQHLRKPPLCTSVRYDSGIDESMTLQWHSPRPWPRAPSRIGRLFRTGLAATEGRPGSGGGSGALFAVWNYSSNLIRRGTELSAAADRGCNVEIGGSVPHEIVHTGCADHGDGVDLFAVAARGIRFCRLPLLAPIQAVAYRRAVGVARGGAGVPCEDHPVIARPRL